MTPQKRLITNLLTHPGN